jgi:hypothetical protein
LPALKPLTTAAKNDHNRIYISSNRYRLFDKKMLCILKEGTCREWCESFSFQLQKCRAYFSISTAINNDITSSISLFFGFQSKGKINLVERIKFSFLPYSVLPSCPDRDDDYYGHIYAFALQLHSRGQFQFVANGS